MPTITARLEKVTQRSPLATAFADQIKSLVELQSVDSDAYLLKKELAAQPAVQKKLEAEFEAKKVHLKKAEEDLRHAQSKQKDKENDLASKEEKIKKLQVQLYSLKSNKEYQAMELEIKGLKADNSVLEEEIIRQIDAVDEVKKKVAQEKEQVAGEEKKFKDELEVLKKRAAELTAQVAALDEKRKSFIANVDPKVLPQYERILQKREGLAIAPVKKSSCGGCNMELPPQMINEIRMQDKLIFCESCSRILYWAG